MPEPGEFSSRVALVTGGAGAGIGGATCHRLAQLGASVVVCDEHKGRVDDMVDDLTSTHGVAAFGLVSDITDRQTLDTGLSAAIAALGPIDICVNNAAINVQGSIFDYDPADWDRVLDVDLTACFYLCRQLLGPMRERRWGRIVNVTSVAAYLGGVGNEPAYGVAKAGLNELTRAIAIEGGPHNIRCNAVAPGLVNSKWVEKQKERYDTFIADTPLRRHAEPVDVANTIAFLCSEESAHITGDVVNLSGGWYLSP